MALVGGGGNPQPGEISLAHNGVLFLGELPEFKRSALEVMALPVIRDPGPFPPQSSLRSRTLRNIPYISIDPIFNYLREEPRFESLIDKINYPYD